MKIGLMIEQLNPARGGAAQWTLQFARELLSRGHEVHIVAESVAAEACALPLIPHCLGRIRSRLALAAAAESQLRSLNLDVIHDGGAGWHCDVFMPHYGSRRAAIEQNSRFAPRWLQPGQRWLNARLPRYREFEALMARQFRDDGRLFVALSNRVAADFRRLHGIPAEQIRVIYNGVDTDRFTPVAEDAQVRQAVRSRLGLSDEGLLLLVVAHNFRLKGVPLLLRAMARLAAQGVEAQLVVAGGKRWHRAAHQAAALGLDGRVRFAGSIADPRPLYAAADVYVHPTFYDPCSLVVLEALASGLPVVTTACNGASELMTQGQEGFVLDDPTDLEQLLARLAILRNPATRRQMGVAARQLALRNTFARNAEQLLAVFEERALRHRRVA